MKSNYDRSKTIIHKATKNIVTFHVVSGDLRGGNDENKLLKDAT